MSVLQQVISAGGPSKVDSVQVLNSGSYYSINSAVSFSGGGTGAAATANTYVSQYIGQNLYDAGANGSRNFAIGYTTGGAGMFPSVNSFTGNNGWTAYPIVQFSNDGMYETPPTVVYTYWSGTGIADGTYNFTGSGIDYSYRNAIGTATVVNNVVTSVNLTQSGLSSSPEYYYIHLQGYPNSFMFDLNASAAVAGPFLIKMNVYGGSTTQSSSFTINLNNDYGASINTTIGLSVNQYSYQQPIYSVSSVTVTNPGQNYYAPPTATISGSVYGAAAALSTKLV